MAPRLSLAFQSRSFQAPGLLRDRPPRTQSRAGDIGDALSKAVARTRRGLDQAPLAERRTAGPAR